MKTSDTEFFNFDDIKDQIKSQRNIPDECTPTFPENFENTCLIFELSSDIKKNVHNTNNNIVEFKFNIDSKEKESKNDILEMFDAADASNSCLFMSSENKLDNNSLESMLTNFHIETQNKLDQILKYLQEELDQERLKRCLLEKKIDSINKLLETYESLIK